MTTLLLTDSAFLDHAVPSGHPERPDRLRAIASALADPAFAGLRREAPPQAEWLSARLAHPADHLAALSAAMPQRGLVALDADTHASPGTATAVLKAVGGAMRAVDAVLAGEVANAFVAARPPGHHAEKRRAMGFCFVNTVAIAARHAQRAHGVQRVAILDWDVHHGNGTQDIFYEDASVLFASTHEMPLYPGTGAPSERGAFGTIVNAPLRAGDDGLAFRSALEQAVLPRIDAHAPDLILISAGFDAHHRDPLANLRLNEADFAWATEQVMAIAARRCGGRVVSVLEGGYDLQGLAGSVAAHVGKLMEA